MGMHAGLTVGHGLHGCGLGCVSHISVSGDASKCDWTPQGTGHRFPGIECQTAERVRQKKSVS